MKEKVDNKLHPSGVGSDYLLLGIFEYFFFPVQSKNCNHENFYLLLPTLHECNILIKKGRLAQVKIVLKL